MGAMEVRIQNRGRVRDEAATRDPSQVAHCDLCGLDVDAVASTSAAGDTFACKSCLRGRLEAMTVATWVLKEAGDAGLPWGKVSG
jgi:hypothetical protein